MKEITNRYLGMTLNKGGFEAHESFWNSYELSKSLRLNKLFNGELIVERKVEVRKNEDQLMRTIGEHGVGRAVLEGLSEEFRPFVPYSSKPIGWEKPKDFYEIEEAISAIIYDHSLSKEVFGNSYTFIHPATGKKVQIHKGSKISKALKHFISDSEKLNDAQVKYSRALNDKLIKGTLCISIHPLDYLTASVNRSGWSSCYDTLDKGCWCASTLSLCTSPNTMIAYLKSDNDENYNGIEWNNKKWRAYVTLNDDNEAINIGKNYPFYSADLCSEVAEMVGALTGKNYSNFESHRGRLHIYTPENMYNDNSDRDTYVYSTNVFRRENLWRANYENVYVSDIGAVCVNCGDRYSDNEDDIVCSDCGEKYYCEHCGERISGEGMNSVPDGYVCNCCLESEYSWCEKCCCYHAKEDITVVDVVYSNGRAYEEYWCEDCIKYYVENETMKICEECGRVMASSLECGCTE